MICILAIDPGVSGAIAFYWPDFDRIAAMDTPVVNNNVDMATLTRIIEESKPTVAIIEQVSAMPKQGVSSTFRFGVSYGSVQGVVTALKIPLHFVTPNVWKKHFRLSAEKEQSRARALQFWPDRSELFKRKGDHGRAEAALLARYYMEKAIRPA